MIQSVMFPSQALVIFNRPGVARALLQTHLSLIHSLSHPFWKYLQNTFTQNREACRWRDSYQRCQPHLVLSCLYKIISDGSYFSSVCFIMCHKKYTLRDLCCLALISVKNTGGTIYHRNHRCQLGLLKV